MDQLCIFKKGSKTFKKEWQLFIDGAARNNPGKAGAGIYLLRQDEPILKKGIYLGIKTNNQAEYIALLLGLVYAKMYLKSNEMLRINSDSQLLVRQLMGIYSVKNPELIKLFNYVKEHLEKINYSICHIPREQNKIADKLANNAIDYEYSLPPDIKELWSKYEL